MPLFKHQRARSRSVSPPIDPEEEQPTRKRSIFSRRSDLAVNNDNHSTSSSSVFPGNGSFFGRGNDPGVAAAREKLRIAEEGEKAADQALIHARQAVTEAREHARRLEAEAEEE